MWRNYLTVGIRSLVKSRTYSIINYRRARHRHGGVPHDPALHSL